jgi:3-hydroxyacyl-CoA dehydrogenase
MGQNSKVVVVGAGLVGTHQDQGLGARCRPSPLIVKLVKAGRYGRKVGNGIYQYRDGQKVPDFGVRYN